MIEDDMYKVEIIYVQTGTTERPTGQHAGMPATAVRVTHTETGTMAQFGLYRSPHANKTAAMEMVEYGLVMRGDTP